MLAPPLPLAMLQALGQRSLSGYVMQSVLFPILAASWFLNIFANASITEISLWATGVWLVTLIGAWLLHRAGKAGPLEALHRRMTYGKGESKVDAPAKRPHEPSQGPAAPAGAPAEEHRDTALCPGADGQSAGPGTGDSAVPGNNA